MPIHPKDRTGDRYGRLLVFGPAGHDPKRGYLWSCICDCGVLKTLPGRNLGGGATNSCGCLRREISASRATHGMTGTRLFRIWGSMLSRCKNPNATGYANYGGRGIAVCDRWLSFEAFAEDMGTPPDDRTLDRVDNDRGYSKENCRWATDREQRNNTRANNMVTAFGETLSVAQWAERKGMKYITLHKRLTHCGWSPEKSLTTEVRK